MYLYLYYYVCMFFLTNELRYEEPPISWRTEALMSAAIQARRKHSNYTGKQSAIFEVRIFITTTKQNNTKKRRPTAPSTAINPYLKNLIIRNINKQLYFHQYIYGCHRYTSVFRRLAVKIHEGLLPPILDSVYI